MTCKPEGTHHHACDCREEVFKRLLEAAKSAKFFIGDLNAEDDQASILYLKIIDTIAQAEEILR